MLTTLVLDIQELRNRQPHKSLNSKRLNQLEVRFLRRAQSEYELLAEANPNSPNYMIMNKRFNDANIAFNRLLESINEIYSQWSIPSC